MENELKHWGVLGMKWGVRRYQNPDGSLTPKGRIRYNKMSDNKLAKTLKKQVRKERAKQYGAINQWMSNHPIGNNTSLLNKQHEEEMRKFRNSQKYKTISNRMKQIDKMVVAHPEYSEKYENEYERLANKLSNSGPDRFTGKAHSSKGTVLLGKNAVDVVKNTNIAYLKDLGYNEDTIKNLVDRIMNSNIKTIYF